jgi:hypothetical protein
MEAAMNHQSAAGIEKLLESAASLRIPSAWLRAMPNHTVAVLLADILSSYLNICKGQGQGTALMDGDELLLKYKPLAKRLGLNVRTVSRGIDCLVGLRTLRRSRRDREINGRKTHNVVGVVPNLEVIAKLSGIAPGDILSAQVTTPAPPRRGSRIPLAAARPTAEPVPLTDFQESLIDGYAHRFEQLVGTPYRTSPEQRLADLRAVASVRIPKARGAGRKYMVWAQQYLEALKAKAEQEHGDASEAAFDRGGHVTERYTIESFIAWAKTDETLPNGFARRSFK